MTGGVRRKVRWLLVLAVAFGVIGMHHVLLACESDPWQPAAAAAGPAAELHHLEHVAAAPPAIHGLLSESAEHCAEMAGHPCLAVLAALIVLLAGLTLALLGAVRPPVGGLASATPDEGARSPPGTSERLSVLCVWRC